MTEAQSTSGCLSPETLALMAAGKLTNDEREAAAAHVASCVDCYEVLMDLATMFAQTPAETPAEAPRVGAAAAKPKPIIVWSRSIIVWSSVAAAIVAAAFIAPRFLGGPDRELNAAVGTLAKSVGTSRPSIGRLNGGFEWGTAPAITRGAATTELPLAVQSAILAVKELAASNKTAKSMDALGVAHLVGGDLDASLTAFEEAVALDPNDARARADLAAARFEKWRRTQAAVDATSALDAAQRALLISPNDAVARFNHALAVEALGLKTQAIDSWNAYLQIDSTSKWADEARAHVAKLSSGGAGGMADSGRDRYGPDLAAAMAAAAHDPTRLECLTRGRQHIIDSRLAFDRSQTAESERLARDARAAFSCGGVPTFEADAQIVWAQYFLGAAAESPALNALALAAKQRGYLRAAGRVQYARGRLADNAARYSDAQELFGDALAMFREAGDLELVASTLIQMAEISKGFGDEAATWDTLSLPLRSLDALAPRRQHMALAGASLTSTQFSLDGASQFFADALVRADERNSTDAVILTGARLMSARAAFKLGDTDGALARLARTREMHARISEGAFRVQFDGEIAELEGTILAARDPRKAIERLTAAMETFGSAGRPLRRARLFLVRGRAYRAAGDLASAEKDWAEGARLFEDQRPDIRDQQQQIDHVDQMWDLFRELISARASNAVASLEVAERFRARALLDSLSKDRQSIPLAGDAMYRWLPPGVTVIAYAVLPDRLLRWTITRGEVTVEPQAIAAKDLAALVDRYRGGVAKDDAAHEAARLSDVLLPESIDPRVTKRIVFLPDGPLFAVPFAALPLATNASRLVVDDFIPSVAPSLTVLKNAAKPVAPSRALLVAAGDAKTSESLPALPGAAAEIRAIAPIYKNATRLDEGAATPSAIFKAMPAAGIVHFAGHAIADSERPSRSRLLVAGSDVVTFDDLRRMPLRPGATVVLSICDAARGPVFHGEGAVGLAYPFLANGAAAVIASIWQIDDATPVSLWQSFHARVTNGDAPDAALAETQRLSRRQGVPASIWAAFESVGGLAGQ